MVLKFVNYCTLLKIIIIQYSRDSCIYNLLLVFLRLLPASTSLLSSQEDDTALCFLKCLLFIIYAMLVSAFYLFNCSVVSFETDFVCHNRKVIFYLYAVFFFFFFSFSIFVKYCGSIMFLFFVEKYNA